MILCIRGMQSCRDSLEEIKGTPRNFVGSILEAKPRRERREVVVEGSVLVRYHWLLWMLGISLENREKELIHEWTITMVGRLAWQKMSISSTKNRRVILHSFVL